MKPVRVNFFTALVQFCKKFLNFRGRSSRSEYWWMLVWGIIFGAALMGLANATGSFAAYTNNPLQAILHGNLMVLLLKGLYFIFSVGDFSLTVRRFRDAGLNAWWSIVMLIPFVDLTNLISGYGFAALYAFVSAALFFFMMYVGLRPSMEDTEDYYAKH